MQTPNEQPPVGLVILAAGASIRMGRPKQLLALNGESLIRRASLAALGSVCRPVVVVLGAHEALIRANICDLPLQLANNTNWEQGMGTSVRVGMQRLLAKKPAVQAVVLMLCDQPMVTSSLINQLVAEYSLSGARIVASEYQGQMGVPALFDQALFGELLQLQGQAGAKKLMEQRTVDCRRFPFPQGALDIDTPEEYRQIHHQFGKDPDPGLEG